MKTFPLAFLCITLATGSYASSTPTPSLDVKSKSSFTLDENTHNPFWPIGWKKSAPKPAPGAAVAERAEPEITASAFALTSVTLGGGMRYAIVNGKVMQQGQKFGLQVAGQTYEVSLVRIEDGRVVLLYHDLEIPVLLRRK